MGIPLFFKIISEKYDDTIIENLPEENCNKQNYLFLDMNCLIHPCCRKLLDDDYTFGRKGLYENRMFTEIKIYIEKLIEFSNPKFIYMAIDGVAPCAKMAQQRLRRFKTFLERSEHNKIKEQLNIDYPTEYWDTNAISPGTKFMIELSKKIELYITTDTIFNDIEVIFSGPSIPGEGEHKILSYIRQNEHNKFDNDNNNILIYGLDADLIMLSLVSGRNNLYLLRESIEFGKPRDGVFLYMDIDQLKCNLILDFKERFFISNKSVNAESMLTATFFNHLIDDYIFICFFLGNDFLPHILSLDLRYEGLDVIMDSYIKVYCSIQTNLIMDDSINTDFLNLFLKDLSSHENNTIDKLFKKRQKLNKFFKVRSVETEYDRRVQILNNYPILNMEEEFLITKDSMYCKDWKKRYYKQCFDFTEKEEIEDICRNYIDGLYWTFKYYFTGCVSWSWNYQYNHAPTLQDISHYLNENVEDINKIKFKADKPVSPIVQLVTIFPKNSISLIPTIYYKLMTDLEYGLLHYYPDEFKLDTLFKRYYWQCVPVLPPIDLELIKQKVGKIKTSNEVKNKFKMGMIIHKKAML